MILKKVARGHPRLKQSTKRGGKRKNRAEGGKTRADGRDTKKNL